MFRIIVDCSLLDAVFPLSLKTHLYSTLVKRRILKNHFGFQSKTLERMDVSIRLDDPQMTFSSGDTVSGNVMIYCPHAVTVSKITASLTGKSILTLTDKTGLFMDWKQEEKHLVSPESRF